MAHGIGRKTDETYRIGKVGENRLKGSHQRFHQGTGHPGRPLVRFAGRGPENCSTGSLTVQPTMGNHEKQDDRQGHEAARSDRRPLCQQGQGSPSRISGPQGRTCREFPRSRRARRNRLMTLSIRPRLIITIPNPIAPYMRCIGSPSRGSCQRAYFLNSAMPKYASVHCSEYDAGRTSEKQEQAEVPRLVGTAREEHDRPAGQERRRVRHRRTSCRTSSCSLRPRTM